MKLCCSKRIFLILLPCLLTFGLRPASGQSDHTAKLIEETKKEGKLVWYTAWNARDSKLMQDGFEKRYPFVKMDVLRSSGEKLLNRIISEARAGQWLFDVVNTVSLGALVHHKLLSPYVSPEAKALMAEFRDPTGYWTATSTIYTVIGYNTKMVTGKEVPKRWEDLLDPKWKGKVSIDQEEYPWYATLLAVWGREKTERYMTALARQEVQWRKGHTLIAQLLAAGEFPVGFVYAHTVDSMQKAGAPVDWVNTVDPVVALASRLAVSARPNYPNTAKLFADFVLSKEGQEIARSAGRIPVRGDIEPLSPKMDPAKLKLKVAPDWSAQSAEYVEEFRRVFGL